MEDLIYIITSIVAVYRFIVAPERFMTIVKDIIKSDKKIKAKRKWYGNIEIETSN